MKANRGLYYILKFNKLVSALNPYSHGPFFPMYLSDSSHIDPSSSGLMRFSCDMVDPSSLPPAQLLQDPGHIRY